MNFTDIENKILPVFVELETSTLCNRRCFYCPNSIYKRGLKQKLIKISLYRRIIEQLADFNYNGEITLHNYNEPLLDPFIFERMKLLKKLLPDTRLTLITNADFLNPLVVRRLSCLGVSTLYVTVHDAINRNYTRKIMRSLIERMGLINNFTSKCNEYGVKYYSNFNKMRVVMNLPAIKRMRPRGQIEKNQVILENSHSMCFLPFSSLVIDYRGNVKICCEIYPTCKQHRRYGIIGNLKELNLKDLWFSDSFNKLRKEILNNKIKNPICENCAGYDLNWDEKKLNNWKTYLVI